MTSANRIIYRKDPIESHVFQIFDLFTEPTFSNEVTTNYAASTFIRLDYDGSLQIIDGDFQYTNSSSVIPIRAYYNFPTFSGFFIFRVSGLILYSGF